MDETERRREKQDAFNKAHGIVPKTVVKSVRDLLEISAAAEDAASAERQGKVKAMTKQQKAADIATPGEGHEGGRQDAGVRAAPPSSGTSIIELRGK